MVLSSDKRLVAVVFGLEGTFGSDSKVGSLLGVEGGQLDSQFGEMSSSNLFVKLFNS